jgi:hypothetical protein
MDRVVRLCVRQLLRPKPGYPYPIPSVPAFLSQEITRIEESFNKLAQDLTLIDSVWDEATQWEELSPTPIEWIQAQAGLRIDRQPINSTAGLLRAYFLLERKNPLENPRQNGIQYLYLLWIKRSRQADSTTISDPPLSSTRCHASEMSELEYSYRRNFTFGKKAT